MPSELKQTARTLVSVALALGIAYAAWLGVAHALGVDSPLLVVVSGSMEPTIRTGDLIIIKHQDPTSITPGTIIVFHSPEDYKELIVHRVIAVGTESGELVFQTKGDHNAFADFWIVPAGYVLGSVAYRIPYLGYASMFGRSPIGITLIGLLTVTLITLEYQRIRQEKAKKERAVDKASVHELGAGNQASSEILSLIQMCTDPSSLRLAISSQRLL